MGTTNSAQRPAVTGPLSSLRSKWAYSASTPNAKRFEIRSRVPADNVYPAFQESDATPGGTGIAIPAPIWNCTGICAAAGRVKRTARQATVLLANRFTRHPVVRLGSGYPTHRTCSMLRLAALRLSALLRVGRRLGAVARRVRRLRTGDMT